MSVSSSRAGNKADRSASGAATNGHVVTVATLAEAKRLSPIGLDLAVLFGRPARVFEAAVGTTHQRQCRRDCQPSPSCRLDRRRGRLRRIDRPLAGVESLNPPQ